jgi:TadE-like protein
MFRESQSELLSPRTLFRSSRTLLLSPRTLFLSSRAKRGIWVLRRNAEDVARFAFGWRSAFSAAINALRLATGLAAEVVKANFSEFPQTLTEKDERAASSPRHQVFYLLRETGAAAIIEFAVALPLLVVLVVGIFDFGGAFNLKQELNNAVREGARFGAAQPTNDLGLAQPPSVSAIRSLVDSYLLTAHIKDCGLNGAAATGGSPLAWTYTASGGGCPGTLTLTINRGNPAAIVTPPHPPYPNLQETINGSTVNIPSTQVWISYPYQWHFNNVIQLLVPSASYTLGNIQSDATAVNTD